MSDIEHIVVCGYPRSGSTLFYNMLRNTVLEYRFYDRETPALWVAEEPGNKITKDPKDVFYADDIRAKLGDSVRFIVTIRDPRAVLCSKHVNTGDRYKVHWDFTWKWSPGTRKRPTRFKRHNVATDKHHGLVAWDKALRKVNADFAVRYEDLVSEPDRVQAALADTFGFTCHGRFSRYLDSGGIPPKLAHQMNGVRPPETSRIEGWREHPKRIKQQFRQCPQLYDILEYYGYETGREWITQI